MAVVSSPHLPAYDYRPGDGPTLVFLHYWGRGRAATGRPVIDRLPGRGTMSIDARGWGRSRELPGPYTLEQLALDTRDVIADAGVTGYVLVGHSTGPARWPSSWPAARPAGLAGLVLVGPGPAKPAAAVTPRIPGRLGARLRLRRDHSRGPRQHPHRHPAERRSQGPDRRRLPCLHSRGPRRVAAARDRPGHHPRGPHHRGPRSRHRPANTTRSSQSKCSRDNLLPYLARADPARQSPAAATSCPPGSATDLALLLREADQLLDPLLPTGQ